MINLRSYILLFTILLISCNERKRTPNISNSSKEKHLIISKVIDGIAEYRSPRNLSPITAKGKFTKKDSIKAREQMLKFIRKQRTIAIDTSLTVYMHSYKVVETLFMEYDFSYFNNTFREISPFENEKNIININELKLKLKKNKIYFDSITYFNPSRHLKQNQRSSYLEIDYRFNFSKIKFSNDSTKAVIRCIYRYGERFPESGVFLLKKNELEWEIIKYYYLI